MVAFKKELILTEYERKYREYIEGLKPIGSISKYPNSEAYKDFQSLLMLFQRDICDENIRTLLDYLKNYRSYRGRIDFNQFNSVLKFPKEIYYQKKLLFNNILHQNIDMVVDYASAVLTHFIYYHIASKDIRKNLDQYFSAIMIDNDYHFFPDFNLLYPREFLVSKNKIHTLQLVFSYDPTIDNGNLWSLKDDYLSEIKDNQEVFNKKAHNIPYLGGGLFADWEYFNENNRLQEILMKVFVKGGSCRTHMDSQPWELVVFIPTEQILKAMKEIEAFFLQ